MMMKYNVLSESIRNQNSYIDRYHPSIYRYILEEKEVEVLINEMLELGYIIPSGFTQPNDDSSFTYPRYKITYKAEEYVKNYELNKTKTNISFYLSIIAILLAAYSAFYK